MKKIAIVTTTFNTPQLIEKQLDCFRKLCQDDFDFIIGDNSTNKEASDFFENFAKKEKVIYKKTFKKYQEANPSDSHSRALNIVYDEFMDQYDYFLFVDHDLFPTKPFSAIGMLGDKILAGSPREYEGKIYFIVSFFIINVSKIDRSIVDFSTYPGLDNGGGLYKIIERYGKECALFLDKVKIPAKYLQYDIVEGNFMHFIKSSNWDNHLHHQESIDDMMEILNKRIEENEKTVNCLENRQ